MTGQHGMAHRAKHLMSYLQLALGLDGCLVGHWEITRGCAGFVSSDLGDMLVNVHSWRHRVSCTVNQRAYCGKAMVQVSSRPASIGGSWLFRLQKKVPSS